MGNSTSQKEQVMTWYNHGMMEDEKGNLVEACDWFKKIIEFQGTFTSEIINIQRSAKFNLGCKLIELGKKEEGLKWLYEVADKENHPGALYYIGVHLERENRASCIRYFVKAARLRDFRAITLLEDLKLSHLIDSDAFQN